jgi:uncharacterized membrane protein YidH (DUF202 family)
MQSSLRAIVMAVGFLLLVAAVMAFGNLDDSTTSAVGPAVLGVIGAFIFLVGLFMPERGLWRQTDADRGDVDLGGASLPYDDGHALPSLDDRIDGSL